MRVTLEFVVSCIMPFQPDIGRTIRSLIEQVNVADDDNAWERIKRPRQLEALPFEPAVGLG